MEGSQLPVHYSEMGTELLLTGNNASIVQVNVSELTTEFPGVDTNDTKTLVTYNEIIIAVLRIDAFLIFLENGFVALCLYTERNTFSKKEFCLQLISLTINDLFVSLSLFLWSFINDENFDKSLIGCALLMTFVLVSQMALLFNVLSICIYRLMFLVCTDRFRFGWKPKTTVIQVAAIYTFCLMYIIIPLVIWGKRDIHIEECSAESLFETGKQPVFIFIGTGLFLPLVVLNVLYGFTFHLLRRHLRKRHRSGHSYRKSKISSKSSSGLQHSNRADHRYSRYDHRYSRADYGHSRTYSRADHKSSQAIHSGIPADHSRTDSRSDHCCSRVDYCHSRTDCRSDHCCCRTDHSCSQADYCNSRTADSRANQCCSDCRTDQCCRSISSSIEICSGENHTVPKGLNHDLIEQKRSSVERKSLNIQCISNQILENENETALMPMDLEHVQKDIISRKRQKRDSFKGANTPNTKRFTAFDNSSKESQKQSLRLIGLLLLLIDISTVPCIIYLIAEKVFPPESIPTFVRPLLCLLVMNNSLLNPWLYAIQSKEVRGALIHNFRKLFCRSCSE